jgi:hypothetical protein
MKIYYIKMVLNLKVGWIIFLTFFLKFIQKCIWKTEWKLFNNLHTDIGIGPIGYTAGI